MRFNGSKFDPWNEPSWWDAHPVVTACGNFVGTALVMSFMCSTLFLWTLKF